MENTTVVFAFGQFGCAGIEALVQAGFAVALVLTHDDSDAAAGESVAALCAQRGIACVVREGQEAEVDARIAALSPAFIFSFYYRSLLPEAVLGLARRGAFNVHTSLLPKYRGRAPINWVLVNGENETGVTLHHMVARADAGDIVAQARVPIADEDTAYTLQQKLLDATKGLLADVLPLVLDGTAPRMKQDLAQGFYCGRRRPEDGRLDWNWPAARVRNLVRAVTAPFPGAFTMAEGSKLLVWEARLAQGQGRAGEVLCSAPLVVACGEGAVEIVTGQFEGAEAVAGARLALRVGDVLG